MNPKKVRELLPEVQEATGVELDCLRDLIDFYWDTIHRELNSLEYNHLMIPHLGTFSIRGDKVLKREIERYERLVAKARIYPPQTMSRYAIYKQKEETLEKLYERLKEYQAEQSKKSIIKQLRKDVRDYKETHGEQETNPGGDR